jgi:hypothetical protein
MLVRANGDHNDYWLWHVLKLDASLLEDWTREWITRSLGANGSFLPRDAKAAIKAAPLATRLRLLASIPESARSFFLGDLVSALVGQDEEGIAFLFSRPNLGDYAHNALAGFPDEDWARKALIARRSGMSPAEVAGACLSGMSHWGGMESDHWKLYVLARERREAVFGFDRGDR